MSKSANKTTPSTSDLLPQHSFNHHQHPIKYINILPEPTTSPVTTNNINPSISRLVSKATNIYKSITTKRISNKVDNASITSSITLPSFQKRKVKKDKIEEFLNKILSRKKNDTTKTHRKIKPPSTIIRNYRNQICHPLLTKKKLKLIRIPMKTISYTYRCGHIKIIKYPPSQQQVAKQPTTSKSSSRRHFSHFKCKQRKQQTTSNYCKVMKLVQQAKGKT